MVVHNKEQNQTTIFQKNDENILVVKRNHLFPQGEWQGLCHVDFDHYLHIISHKKEFHPRSLMEVDFTYKQIIPYLVFKYEDSYFLMQRRTDASESRLRNKLTLGIGGHIREEDMSENSLFEWARREFYEEVHYPGTFSVRALGIINDDSNDVGKVHIGFVFLLTGDSPCIEIKSELKSGVLVPLQKCIDQKDCFESWSQMVIDFLQNNLLLQ